MSVVANAADADDVLQESAIIGIRKLGTFTPGTSFTAWMGEVVRNVALNRRREGRRRVLRFGEVADADQLKAAAPDGSSPTISRAGVLLPDQAALDDTILAALAQLDPITRACILLRCIEGLEYAEISSLLGIPKGTALSCVFRGRRALAKLLTPQSNEAE